MSSFVTWLCLKTSDQCPRSCLRTPSLNVLPGWLINHPISRWTEKSWPANNHAQISRKQKKLQSPENKKWINNHINLPICESFAKYLAYILPVTDKRLSCISLEYIVLRLSSVVRDELSSILWPEIVQGTNTFNTTTPWSNNLKHYRWQDTEYTEWYVYSTMMMLCWSFTFPDNWVLVAHPHWQRRICNSIKG